MMEPIATASHCHFLWGAELEYLNRESLFSSEIKMWWYFGELWYWWELRLHFLGESRVVIVWDHHVVQVLTPTPCCRCWSNISSDCKQEKGLCNHIDVQSVQVCHVLYFTFASHLAYQWLNVQSLPKIAKCFQVIGQGELEWLSFAAPLFFLFCPMFAFWRKDFFFLTYFGRSQ